MQESARSHSRFTVAVVPDTQNYVSYRNQRAAGFPFNARELLWDMMHFIARNAVGNGGEIAFATALGDMWQHQMSADVDAAHARRGHRSIVSPLLADHVAPAPEQVLNIEIPAVRTAYEILAGQLPFSVVPGNHDHDHMWADADYPPQPGAIDLHRLDLASVGSIHCGSLENWTRNFGAQTPFFKNQPWYVSSFRQGANSDQIFTGGTHRFLHLGLEMSPDGEVVDWAESVLQAFPGVPTIVSIHEFLNPRGERQAAECLDLSRLDPERHTPDRLWDSLISRHDQILAVLNGHFHGVRHRVDPNQHGNQVFQFLSDYQGRKQSLRGTFPDATVIDGIGDGWLRLMEFDLDAQRPRLRLRAYSTYFKAYASDLPQYAAWYGHEHPEMSEAEFRALDDVEFDLVDFHTRFERARVDGETANETQMAQRA